ncbi:hypothetical protein D3C81_1641790 [compost metagenome]
MTIDQLDELMGDSQWQLTKAMIRTEAIESYMEQIEQAPIEQVMIEATSADWGDAVNALTAIAALIGNKKMAIDAASPDHTPAHPPYDKTWEWMTEEHKNQIIRKRSKQLRTERSDLDEPTEPGNAGGNEDDV